MKLGKKKRELKKGDRKLYFTVTKGVISYSRTLVFFFFFFVDSTPAAHSIIRHGWSYLQIIN